MPSKKKHLLILRFSSMGDVAMTVPVVKALTEQYPDLKVTIASRFEYKPFFDTIPGINFFDVDFTRQHKGALGLWKLFKDLRRLHVFAVADLHNVLRSKIITKLFSLRSKKIATTDKMRDVRATLTAATNKVFEPMPSVIQRHANALAELGFPIDLSKPNFPAKQEMSDDILFIAGGPKAGRWIGIAPFAQHRSKVYPRELMQQVIDKLAANATATVFLFGGGKQEAKLLKQFADEKLNVVVIAGGKMTLKQELKLISNLDIMLSMDSANAHMAAMLGIPVVTLWGATHPYAGFVPFMQPLENALTSDRERYPKLPTSIYGNKVVPGYEDAMETITPNSVVAKINEVLLKK